MEKSTALLRTIVDKVTPQRNCLDRFAGTLTTSVARIATGLTCTSNEKDTTFFKIAQPIVHPFMETSSSGRDGTANKDVSDILNALQVPDGAADIDSEIYGDFDFVIEPADEVDITMKPDELPTNRDDNDCNGAKEECTMQLIRPSCNDTATSADDVDHALKRVRLQ